MKKRKKTIRISAIILIVSLLFLVGVLSVSAFLGGSLNYEEDERLFLAAKTGNVTKFYANASLNSGEYVPVEISAITMDKEMKSYYKLDDISSYLKEGFIAVEDREFYKHEGVNFKRTVLALFNHIFKVKNTFGASTITQQVVKNISGDSEVTARRKIAEIFRAMRIEDNHTKEEILELYLNIVPLGENIVGVGMGSLHYFGKEASELSPEEAAVLIGLTNAPTLYNPHTNPERCLEKRNTVLFSMMNEGVIGEAEYDRAIQSELSVVPRDKTLQPVYSWFVETVIEDAAADYAREHKVSEEAARFILLASGYKIYTTENIQIQNILEGYFENLDNFPDERRHGLDYSMVISDSTTGELLGIVGSVGRKNANLIVNQATTPHTPASTLKPLALYAPLIESKEINWATVFDDVPLEFIDGERPYPANSPNVYSGLITVKDALRTSKNTVAMKLYSILGPERIYNSLKNDFGFSLIRNQYNKSGQKITDLAPAPLALGQLSKGVSLRQLTESYTVFSAYGTLNKGRSYISVIDSEGNTVLQNTPESKRVFSRETAEIINQLLMNVVDTGTARSVNLKNLVDTAGKTGTSGGNLEKLFVGYTPYLTAGIRCSYNDSKTPIATISPSHLAVWDEVMTQIHSLFIGGFDEGVKGFSTSGLFYEPYCKDSGELFSASCILDPRGSRIEYGYFTGDNRPSEICTTHVQVKYDAITGAIAHDGCPQENLITISLIDIPNRSFPKEVVVVDAEYVYRRVSELTPKGDSYYIPYFQYALDDGEYVGIGADKKQFNHSCYLHD